METLLRFTVSIFLITCLTTINTSETGDINSNESSIPETPHSDEDVETDSKIHLSNEQHSSYETQELSDTQTKSLHDEHERRRRLKSIHDNLANKLQKALVKKLTSPEYSQRINATSVQKYLSEHVANNDLNLASGRRSFDNTNNESDEVAVQEDEENPSEADDGRRNLVKNVKYVIDQHPNLSSHQAQTLINLSDDNNPYPDLESLNQGVSGMRTGYSVVTQNKNGILKSIPYQTSLGYLNNNRNQISKLTSLPSYYLYKRPFLDISNPIQMYYNTHNYPINRFIKLNSNNFFDYGNHANARNNQFDFQQVAAYLTSLMNAENYANSDIIDILKDANNLNFAEINNVDQSQLVKINKSDLDNLKRYIILILNKYGMTPYVLRLLEYVNLVEGRPKNEIYLVFKILSNQQAVYGLNKIESDQLRAHLQYLLNEYGKSPYILPFVKTIGGIQIQPNANNRLYILDFGNLDPSGHLNKDNMRKINLHLTQIYNNNQNILKVLQNINRIYENYNGATILPELDLNDYQNLSYLNQNDLYLLAKYVSQIKRQRGDHSYLNQLLIYIQKLQTLDKGINIINDGQAKGLDLTGLYQILLDINNKNRLSPEILAILNRLINKKTITLNDTEQISNDLKVIKDYLLQNQIYQYDSMLNKILNELNNANEEEILPPIEDDSQKLININVQELELIYQYLLGKEKIISSPYLVLFVNQILQLLQRAKHNPYENVIYKFRYTDLLQLFNVIQPYENDKRNPIYIMISHYLDQGKDDIKKYDNGTIPNADLKDLNEYFGGNRIDLDIIYKFLLYEIEQGNPNSVLFELLQHIKRTLLLPNGKLKINIVHLNETQPLEQIHPKDLEKLYLYLLKLREDKIISVKLLEFYKKLLQRDKQNLEIFYNVTKESLNRVRNFLIILLKERRENPYVLEILFEINHILGIPKNDYRNTYLLNGTSSEVNEDDLKLLIKYFSDFKVSGDNNDIVMILEYLEEAKERIKNGKQNTKEKWIYVNVLDLEQIYKYLLGKEKFLHSPYLALFVNDILPLIQRAKLNPYENVIYKFRYIDLLQLYESILSQETDIGNPIYIKILQLLDLDNDDITKNNNGTIPNDDLYVLSEYFDDKQINLDIVYKFLIHEIESGNRNEVLLGLLQLIKKTLLLPNGQLKIKTINLNDTELSGQIHQKDIQNLYLYILKLINHKGLSLELLDYIKKYKQREKQMLDILSDFNQESLIRVRNFLLSLIKELGENPFVLDILFEINHILGIPESYDKHEQVLNGTKYEVNEQDLELLIKYSNEMNLSDENSDLVMILDYLHENQKRIKSKEESPNEKWIKIDVHDLEQIYQYLLGKDTFINSPYLVIFVNEILPFIQRAKLNPNENVVYKFRHSDLLQLFNLILSEEKDKENPIYIKILNYLDQNKDDYTKNNNGTTPNLDLNILNEYFEDEQINLDIVYKFLIHEIESGNQNKVLLELLQLIKRTLLLPNGQLKIKIINLNDTESTRQIHPKDLQKLYLYLQKIIEDKIMSIELLDSIKEYKQKMEIFTNATKVSLIRIRNFLLVLIKEGGENPYVLEILLEINRILGIPKTEERRTHVLNGTYSEVNEDDLKLLIKYFSGINVYGDDNDLLKIIEYLHETQEKIKNKEDNSYEKWIYINAQDLQQIYQYLLSKDTFINSPYLVMFVNEILPFIHRAKERPYENLLYKFKYLDLLQLFKFIVSHEKDKENPIYIKILQYLDESEDDITKNNNGTTPDVDLYVLNEYFGDNKINLDIVYKFLIHEIESGNHNKVLLGLLQFIKKTLLLPNGQLKIKTINLNDTELSGQIHQKDLQKLYLYLQKLIEDKVISIELLDYIKKYEQKEKQMLDILSDVNQESLIRVRNFLLILIKEVGENPFVLDILFEINHILGIPESYDKHEQVLNGTKYEVNEQDLGLLVKYLSEINIYGKNSDIINILDYLYEIKEKIKQEKENPKEQWVSVNVHELELVYQYLLEKQKYSNSPYLVLFLNEILPLIQRAKEHPNENVIYKFRYVDLMKIYNFMVSHENDKENPLLIKILHYLEQVKNNGTKYDNGTMPNVDLNEYFGDNKINLDIVYKFLLHEIKSGNSNKLLLELSQLINRTLLLPNGQLKIKTINLNGTELTGQIHPKDLQEIYLYLQKLIDDDIISNDLLKFYKKRKQEEKQKLDVFSNATKESLNRLRNFILILLEERGENPSVVEILFDINRVLEISESDNKRYQLNDTNHEADENDLELLLKYLSIANVPKNIDVLKILEYIYEGQQRIKNKNENIKKSKSFKLHILEILNNDDISPDIQDILKSYLEIGMDRLNHTGDMTELDLNQRKEISKLNPSDLNVLSKYLQNIIDKFGPIYRVEQLIYYIDKLKEKSKKDNIIIYINTTHTNETQNTVNITRHDLDVFNKYLLDLIDLYGENPDILHILFKINNIKGEPGIENDWLKLITKTTNDVGTLKLGDINELVKYILHLIKKQGATTQLLRILRDFSQLPNEPIEDVNRKITRVNSTHTLVSLDNDDVSRIKSYLVKIINDNDSNPLLVNILRVISRRGEGQDDDYNVHENSNIYEFAKLNQNDLNQLTRYMLQLIDKQGTRPELVEILYLIYQIYGDVGKEEEENKKEQYVLEISKEIKKLREINIIQTIRNMDKKTLITLYMDMLENIFNAPNVNNDFSRIMLKLLDIYKKEESPIKKYIILKWYEFLIQNKGASYKILRNPDFINRLLELDGGNEHDREIIVTTENYINIKPHDYSSDIEKVLNELIDNTLRNKPTNVSHEDDNKTMSNKTTDERSEHELRDRIEEKISEGKSCVDTNRKFKEIWKVLKNIKKIHRHDIDLSKDDLERIFDIIAIFVNQLKFEKHRSKIPTSLVIDELENRLLTQHTEECHQKSNTIKELISTVVVHLRDIISFLKSNNFSKDEIMIIVKSTLEEDIMPDINALSVQECTAAANKEILDALLSNVYSKTYEKYDVGELASDDGNGNGFNNLST